MRRPGAVRRTDVTGCSSGNGLYAMTGTVLLVRHGETEWNRIRRSQGWLASPLTLEGIAQAEAIGRRLRLVPEAAAAEIVASPLGRARRTAEIIAECLASGVQDAARYPHPSLPRK